MKRHLGVPTLLLTFEPVLPSVSYTTPSLVLLMNSLDRPNPASSFSSHKSNSVASTADQWAEIVEAEPYFNLGNTIALLHLYTRFSRYDLLNCIQLLGYFSTELRSEQKNDSASKQDGRLLTITSRPGHKTTLFFINKQIKKEVVTARTSHFKRRGVESVMFTSRHAEVAWFCDNKTSSTSLFLSLPEVQQHLQLGYQSVSDNKA